MGLENPLHIAILVIIILVVFGAKRLPEIGRSLGEGMRGFKDSISGDSSSSQTLPPPAPPVPPAPPAANPPAPAAGAPPVAEPPQPQPQREASEQPASK